MEASQLKISPDNLRFKPMPRKKKLELRRENIKAFIKAKPAGTIITMKEFAKVASTSEQNVYSMIQTMVKRKQITKIPSGRGLRYAWAVNDATTRSVFGVTRTVIESLPSPDTTATFTVDMPPRLTTEKVIEMAKEFAWQENSDSLRAFIQSLSRR